SANFKDIPNELIHAIVDSNDTRKKHITNMILREDPKVVGIYRLTMNTDSDIFRQSAIQDVIHHLQRDGIDVVIYEPIILGNEFDGLKVIDDILEFKQMSDVIVANRLDDMLEDVRDA